MMVSLPKFGSPGLFYYIWPSHYSQSALLGRLRLRPQLGRGSRTGLPGHLRFFLYSGPALVTLTGQLILKILKKRRVGLVILSGRSKVGGHGRG